MAQTPNPLVVGQRVTLQIDRLAFGGDAIGRGPDGRVIFVRGAAPGDQVVAEIVEVKRRHARAETRAVEPGESRAAPFCAHVDRCGGCPWMVAPDDVQAAAIEAHVHRGLGRFAAPDALEPITVVSPTRAWRSTARLRWQDGRLGYRMHRSHALLEVAACPVLADPLPALLDAIRRHCADALVGAGTVRLTASATSTSGTVELRPDGRAPALTHAARRLLTDPACHGVVCAPEGGPAVSFGEPADLFDGVRHPTGAFVQAHQPGNRALVAAVVDALSDTGEVLELFAGSGNFTFALAKAGVDVTAVELDGRAVDALNAEARERGLGDRVRARAADLTRRIRLPRGPFDAVLLDPPRGGARAVVRHIARWRLQRVVYVSCNPATLTRDVGVLAEHGWRVVRARPLHLFPHTGHAEVLTVLERRG